MAQPSTRSKAMTKSEQLAATLERHAIEWADLALLIAGQGEMGGYGHLIRDCNNAAAHLRALQRAVEDAEHSDDCAAWIEAAEHGLATIVNEGSCDCFKAEFMREVE